MSKNAQHSKSRKTPRCTKTLPPLQPEEVIAAKRQNIEQKRYICSFIAKVTSLLLALVLIFSFVFGISIMRGEDMYPRMRDGDVYLFYRLEKDYHIGDVVTFSKDGERFTARIVAAGGDTVDMSKDGELIVNGNIQDEEIFYITSSTDAAITLPCVVDANSYFLLCDFRTLCEDSRTYGTVSKDQLDGKVITILRRRGI